MSRFLLIGALFLLTLGVHAQEMALSPALSALPYEGLGEHHSQPGETLAQFLLRDVAPAMATYTHRTGWETCARIAKAADGTFGVRLSSNHVQIGCLAGQAGVPEDMTWTGETIHSHPDGLQLTLTDTDRAWAQAVGDTATARSKDFSVGLDNGFSAADFKTAGYLVASGRLLYQPGRVVPRPRLVGSVTSTNT